MYNVQRDWNTNMRKGTTPFRTNSATYVVVVTNTVIRDWDSEIVNPIPHPLLLLLHITCVLLSLPHVVIQWNIYIYTFNSDSFSCWTSSTSSSVRISMSWCDLSSPSSSCDKPVTVPGDHGDPGDSSPWNMCEDTTWRWFQILKMTTVPKKKSGFLIESTFLLTKMIRGIL
jgi:hypothetical protein